MIPDHPVTTQASMRIVTPQLSLICWLAAAAGTPMNEETGTAVDREEWRIQHLWSRGAARTCIARTSTTVQAAPAAIIIEQPDGRGARGRCASRARLHCAQRQSVVGLDMISAPAGARRRRGEGSPPLRAPKPCLAAAACSARLL